MIGIQVISLLVLVLSIWAIFLKSGFSTLRVSFFISVIVFLFLFLSGEVYLAMTYIMLDLAFTGSSYLLLGKELSVDRNYKQKKYIPFLLGIFVIAGLCFFIVGPSLDDYILRQEVVSLEIFNNNSFMGSLETINVESLDMIFIFLFASFFLLFKVSKEVES
jgi:hypothetical protein